jgi:cytoskeletal protein CcmA (bactofilin family)
VTIGKSIVVKGELSGKEDLTIEGRIEGKVDLSEHVLTIGQNAKVKAQVSAKSIVVIGEVTGNIAASERISIREEGSVEGDIAAPRVAIAEGATFRGSIDMRRTQVGGGGGKTGGGQRPGGPEPTPAGGSPKP